jgi:hypothetical protein
LVEVRIEGDERNPEPGVETGPSVVPQGVLNMFDVDPVRAVFDGLHSQVAEEIHG